MRELPLRVAMFSDSALPILNGVSISIDALIREMRNKGHSVDLYTASYYGYRDPDPNTIRFPALETPWTKGYPLAVPPFYPMLRHFRKRPYDVVHTHTPFTIGFVGMRWAQSHELPLVTTYHTLYDRYSHYIPYLPKRYVRFKIAKHTNFYYNRADHVITPSEASMQWLRRHTVHTPISVIPTGVPPPKPLDRSEVREQLGIEPEHRVLLYVGRIAKEKNLETLLTATATVFQRDRSARLLLVGDGPYRDHCAALARSLGIGDRVRIVGFVPRTEVDPYYAAADLFVFSSMTETQGLVIYEAMTYGLPAVAIAGGGAGAAVTDGVNGFVVPNDHRTFSDAVLRLLGDDSLFARLSEGAVRAARELSTSAMADKILDAYRIVLGRKQTNLGEGQSVRG